MTTGLSVIFSWATILLPAAGSSDRYLPWLNQATSDGIAVRDPLGALERPDVGQVELHAGRLLEVRKERLEVLQLRAREDGEGVPGVGLA